MIESWNMKGGNKPEASVYTHAYSAQRDVKQDILFVPQAKHLNIEPLRVPTHPNVFIAIGGDDIPLIRR